MFQAVFSSWKIFLEDFKFSCYIIFNFTIFNLFPPNNELCGYLLYSIILSNTRNNFKILGPGINCFMLWTYVEVYFIAEGSDIDSDLLQFF